MTRKYLLFTVIAVFPAFLPPLTYGQLSINPRDIVIARTLDIIETHSDLYAQEGNYPYRSTLEPVEFEYGKDISLTDPLVYALGERGHASFGILSGYIKGRTRYHISFDNPYALGGHGESELDWPLSNFLVGIKGSLNYRLNSNPQEKRDRARLEFSWFLDSLDKDSGKMEDSDWIENDVGYIDYYDDGVLNNSSAWASDNSGKDIYSESPAKLDDINIIDINYIYNIWLQDDFAVGPKFGYLDQKFDFSSYSLDQVGYGPYGPSGLFDQSYTDARGLKWGLYKIHYRMLYFGLGSEFKIKEDFSLFSSFAYSPWVHIKDADTHLYPTSDEATGINHDMLSEGHSDGHAYFWNINGKWCFLPDWSLDLGWHYVDLEAKGDMVQKHYYDGVLTSQTEPIGERVTCEYWLVDVSLRYIF